MLANTARVHDLHLTNASVYVQRSGAALDDRIYAGGLVGGASLKVDDFMAIIDNAVVK